MRKAHNRLDLTGQKYGFLTVLENTGVVKGKNKALTLWKCQCTCGKSCIKNSNDLRHHKVKTCGCRSGKSPGRMIVDNMKVIDECWIWQRGRDKDGYGQVRYKVPWKSHTNIRAHQLAYWAFWGEIPLGKVVMHTCDNPSCVNPLHLHLGTFGENNADMAQKGRASHGAQNINAKLTERDVRHIRELYELKKLSDRKMARKFDVSSSSIRQIRLNLTWKHVK